MASNIPVPASEAPRIDMARVVYNLSNLAGVGGGRVLVVGFGNAMKGVVKACVHAQIGDIWVTGTEDKLRGFSCSGSAQVAVIAVQFDKRLFANEYAVLKACESCGADALLIADPESPLAQSALLVQEAAKFDAIVLAALPHSKDYEHWLLCEPARDAQSDPLWRQCPKCRITRNVRDIRSDGGVCPECGSLYRLGSEERVRLVFDPESFTEWDADVEERDPLDFPGFDQMIKRARVKSGCTEGVRCGLAELDGIPVALAVMEASFMMGSMGYVVGEKISRTVERATKMGLPLIIFTCSGGARMQEGLVSLMQMAKVSAAIERHGAAGLPYFSVICDPTTGGVTASFAMQGDVIISEPHALIGFAGRRVIQDTIKQTLPESFQTAEFCLEHGLIDAIVERTELRGVLANLAKIHVVDACSSEGRRVEQKDETPDQAQDTFHEASAAPQSATTQIDAKKPGLLSRAVKAVAKVGWKGRVVIDSIDGDESRSVARALRKRGVADVPGVKPVSPKDAQGNAAWESVMLARNVHRPTSQYYIDRIVDDFVELHGDRMFADDGAIVAGLGWIGATPVTVIAQEKGADLNQRIARNFGCPQPEGYRKALRLMRQAEKFGRPVVCLVDTQGAFCGMEAEERGQGNAIADNLVAQAGLSVPIVSVVLGEGGSGGALALAMGNRVAMQKHAVYSVLSPEGFASILWKDRSRAAEAAAVMKMSADEACAMGIVEEVLSEGAGPAHENPEQAVAAVRDFVERSLEELSSLSPEEIRAQRYERFRNM